MTSSSPNRPQDPLQGSAIHRLLNRPLNDQDLLESTQRVAQPLIHSKSTTRGYLLFSLDHERFLLPSQAIDRVTRLSKVRRIPHRSNPIVRGLCQLEGDLIVCGNLAALMQLAGREEPSNEDSSRMIVIGTRDRWVVQVDTVFGVVQLGDEHSQQPPVTVREARQRFVDRLTIVEDALASVLDAPAIISAFQAALS